MLPLTGRQASQAFRRTSALPVFQVAPGEEGQSRPRARQNPWSTRKPSAASGGGHKWHHRAPATHQAYPCTIPTSHCHIQGEPQITPM